MSNRHEKPNGNDAPGYYLSVDVGTHAVKAALFSPLGLISEPFSVPLTLNRRSTRVIEQNPLEILKAVNTAINKVLSGNTFRITSAALAIQRSTVVAWNRVSGKALSPALSWQDTRGYDFVRSIAHSRLNIEQRSGLVLSSHYGASKLRWLQQELKQSDAVCLSPLVSFILFHILEGRVVTCDESNAGRTQLWNIAERKWDASLCTVFDVQQNLLPQVQPTLSFYGNLKRRSDSGQIIPLVAVAGDQNAAFYGVMNPVNTIDECSLLVNIGSGAFILGALGSVADNDTSKGLLNSIVLSTQDQCLKVLEGTVNGAGLSLTWFSKSSEIQDLGGETWLLNKLHGWLQKPYNSDVYFYNSVGGLGSPFWQLGSEPFFEPSDSPIESKAVAIIESIVFLLAVNIKKMRISKVPSDIIRISGGVSRFDGLCQRLANILQCRVVRGQQHEVTLLGAARLASNFQIPSPDTEDKVFNPIHTPQLSQRYTQYLNMIAKTTFNWVSHRGYASAYPENSLRGIEESIKQGVKYVELDIQITQDGVPVVFHDYEMQRLAQVKGVINNYSFLELQTLSVHEPERFGQKFFPAKIPSLQELVERIMKYKDAHLFVEVKKDVFTSFSRENALRLIWNVLQPLKGRCTIISYDLAILRLVQTQRLSPVGWVLKKYSSDEYLQIKENPVDIVICNKNRLPPKQTPLWKGPWDWFAYEISSDLELQDCLQRGIVWLESRNAVGLFNHYE